MIDLNNLERNPEQIISNAEEVFEEINNEDAKLNALHRNDIKKFLYMIQNSQIEKYWKYVNDPNALKDFNYSELSNFYEKIELLQQNLEVLKEDIDIEKFMIDGHIVDWHKLKKMWSDKNLRAKYPKLEWSRLKDWIDFPKTELDFEGVIVKYDKYIVRKYNYAIIQSIFDEMDLYILNVGPEGAGKSCWTSQQILYFYTAFKYIGLIDYAYDVQKLFYSDLEKFFDAHAEQDIKDLFRIECLDEGYALNRQMFHDKSSQLFKEEMRSDRKLLRVQIINLPQMGELDTTITLSRINLIFYVDMDSDFRTGTLKKGYGQLYIVPRGKRIYSPKFKKDIYQEDIKNKLAKYLSDKSQYYKHPPEDIVIKDFKFHATWGVNKDDYDRYIKDQNKERRSGRKKIAISDYILWIIVNKSPDFKFWDFDKNNPFDLNQYKNIVASFKKIRTYLEQQPDLEEKLMSKYVKYKNNANNMKFKDEVEDESLVPANDEE
jgi:hypothetical protein